MRPVARRPWLKDFVGRSEPLRYLFSLEGLHCENCARTLTEALGSCDVVTDVRVYDDLRHADIELREDEGAIAAAVEAVQAAGYRVSGFGPVTGGKASP